MVMGFFNLGPQEMIILLGLGVAIVVAIVIALRAGGGGQKKDD